MLPQMSSFLSEMLSWLWNDASEASEKCWDGGIRRGRGGEEWQWSSSPPGSWLNSSQPDSL